MSAKERLLSSAQKFILKGQFDKAVKDYEQLVTIDTDVRHRHKLAELLVRAGRKDDAVKEYERIAAYYTNNGFYLKSIAVYKQIQKLLPNDINVTLSLASLNDKQGLKGNALAEYKIAVDYFERSGDAGEAARVLDLMVAVDPANTNIVHKLAETLFVAGSTDAAYDTFMSLALQLRNGGDKAAFERITTRIRRLFPDRTDFVLDLLENQIRTGSPLETVPALKQFVKRDPRVRRPWDLLLAAYGAVGDDVSRKAVTRQMLRFFPEDPALRIQLVETCFAAGELEEGLGELGDLADRFLARGLREKIEELYLRVYEIAPEDTRVLENLQEFYGRTGQEGKQADILARIAILSSTRDFSDGSEGDLFSQEAASVGVPEPVSDEPQGEEHWEEEIDLSLSDDYLLDIDFDGIEQQALAQPSLPGEELLALADEEAPDATLPPVEEEEQPFEPFTLDEIEASFGSLSEGGGADEGISLSCDRNEERNKGFADDDMPGFDAVLAQSLAAVPSEPEGEDSETHYDLGCAYREMGLLAEAIAEFRKAGTDRRRKIDCLILEAMCHRDRGDIAQATEVLARGFEVTAVTRDETAALNYELGMVYELNGRYAEALKEYRVAHQVIRGFRDAEEKIAALASLVGETADL